MRLPVDLIAAGVMLATCGAAPPLNAKLGKPRSVCRSLGTRDVVKIGSSHCVAAGANLNDPPDYDETGTASWYGEELRGSRTANGERFDPDGVSAAHRTLPMQSYVEVTLLATGRTILVRVNDRGPFHSNRIIDLSFGAARQLGMTGRGARQVRIRRVEPTENERHFLRRGKAVAVRRSLFKDRLAQPPESASWKPSSYPATTAHEPDGYGPFYLQIASFLSRQRALSLAGHLNGQVAAIAGMWRVRLGPYESANKAIAALAPLAARGYPGALITR